MHVEFGDGRAEERSLTYTRMETNFGLLKDSPILDSIACIHTRSSRASLTTPAD
jgi:hypothetical protein